MEALDFPLYPSSVMEDEQWKKAKNKYKVVVV